jgi:hypothetical protein
MEFYILQGALMCSISLLLKQLLNETKKQVLFYSVERLVIFIITHLEVGLEHGASSTC